MNKVFLVLLLAFFAFSTALSLDPIKVAVFTTNSATVNVQVFLNDYTGGTGTVKYTGPIVAVTPNSSGIIIANVANNIGNDWGSITASQVNSYYLLDVKINGALFAQYRLDQLILSQAQAGSTDTDGNLSPSENGNGGLGSDNSRWSDLFVNGNTIHVGPAGGMVGGTEMALSYNLSPNKGTINVDNHDVMEITKNEVNITNSNSGNTSNILGVNSNGVGNGVSVSLTNSSNSGRGVEVTQAGVGPGVFATSTGGNGVWGITTSISAAGVIGDNTFGEAVVGRNRGGNGVGAVVGRNDSSGYGVRGFNTKNGYGVIGQAGISGGTGVAGRFENVNAANTSNVIEVSTNGIGNGISVALNNPSNGSRGIDVLQTGVGPGVFATSTGGNAVWGITSSISAAGVIGDNTFGEAVVGRNRGGNGVGAVVGRNDSSGYGVRGFNTKNGYGVIGQAGISGGTGVAGRFENVNAANTSDALQVVTNSAGNAARFTGNVVISGNLTVSGTVAKGGGSFMIDHPLDPKNKILYHSFVESPDMKNINDGVITLDSKGEAWVQLPDWFEALNGDFRYQLTAIGAPCPNLYISEEVNNNRFKIAGGTPGMKVSWMVTGIRHDPYAMKHRIQVEVEKTPEQKGHYLQPDAYGEIDKTIINVQSIQTQSSISPALINSETVTPSLKSMNSTNSNNTLSNKPLNNTEIINPDKK